MHYIASTEMIRQARDGRHSQVFNLVPCTTAAAGVNRNTFRGSAMLKETLHDFIQYISHQAANQTTVLVLLMLS